MAHAWATRPSAAFQAETLGATLGELYGDRTPVVSDAIKVITADLAENGAVVPVKIETTLAGPRTITIIASKNPVPLVATFILGATTAGFVATRVKLAESCEVIAVIETADGLFKASKAIEVTIGGCGA